MMMPVTRPMLAQIRSATSPARRMQPDDGVIAWLQRGGSNGAPRQAIASGGEREPLLAAAVADHEHVRADVQDSAGDGPRQLSGSAKPAPVSGRPAAVTAPAPPSHRARAAADPDRPARSGSAAANRPAASEPASAAHTAAGAGRGSLPEPPAASSARPWRPGSRPARLAPVTAQPVPRRAHSPILLLGLRPLSLMTMRTGQPAVKRFAALSSPQVTHMPSGSAIGAARPLCRVIRRRTRRYRG